MNHIIEPQEAIEVIKHWILDFDSVIEQILNGKTIDEEKDDANESL